MSRRLPRSVHAITSQSSIRHFAKLSVPPVKQHWNARLPQWERDPTYHRVVPPQPRDWQLPHIPSQMTRPRYAENGTMSPWDDMIPLAYPIGPEEWYDQHLADGMRHACRMARKCLEFATKLVVPGITTLKINQEVMQWALKHNCYPSSLNYGGFPASLCTSVNNVLSHGVPNEYLTLTDGELMTVNLYWREVSSIWTLLCMFHMNLLRLATTAILPLPFPLATQNLCLSIRKSY